MRANQPHRIKARRQRALKRRQADLEAWQQGSHPTVLKPEPDGWTEKQLSVKLKSATRDLNNLNAKGILA